MKYSWFNARQAISLVYFRRVTVYIKPEKISI